MLTAILAALAMCASDLFGTIMVMAEAGARGWIAGVCDTLGYYVSLLCTWISVDALNGHDTAKKAWVLVLVGVANLLATRYATLLGKRLLARYPSPVSPEMTALTARVQELEARLGPPTEAVS